MSGVWVFRDGVARLVTNPSREKLEEPVRTCGAELRRKVLVHVPSNDVIKSHEELERRLQELGWTRYPYVGHPELLRFHRPVSDSPDLISVPRRFSCVTSVHMYDIVVKNRSFFEVRDA